MLDPSTLEERETDFVEFPVDRLEVRRFQLPRPGTPCLDRRLVHRLDARGANRVELRGVDRLEQPDALLPDSRPCSSTHLKGGAGVSVEQSVLPNVRP